MILVFSIERERQKKWSKWRKPTFKFEQEEVKVDGFNIAISMVEPPRLKFVKQFRLCADFKRTKSFQKRDWKEGELRRKTKFLQEAFGIPPSSALARIFGGKHNRK